MPGRDTFFVGNDKYLKNANYTLALGEDVYCAAYRERLWLGPIEFTDGEAKFSKKRSLSHAMSITNLLTLFAKLITPFILEVNKIGMPLSTSTAEITT